MESFGRYIAVIMAIGLLFVVPAQQGNVRMQRIRKVYATELVHGFVEKSARRGEITLQEWELLYKRLQEGKCLLFLTVSVGEERDSGYNISYYRMTYHDEIKEILFKEGRYPLRTGDILMLEMRGTKADWYECVWQSV